MKLYELAAKSKITAAQKEDMWWYIEGGTDFPKKYVKITSDGQFTVDLSNASGPHFSLNIGNYGKWVEELPYKFEKITLGNKRLYVRGSKLKNLKGLPTGVLEGNLTIESYVESLEGCPQEIDGEFSFWNNYTTHSTLKSWEHAPHTVKTLKVKAPSLIGIHEHIKHITSGVVIIETQPNRVDSTPHYKEGGLGLILIPGVKEIRGTFSNTTDIPDGPFSIIQKYAGRPDDVFECQAELIEQGFEEFAKL